MPEERIYYYNVRLDPRGYKPCPATCFNLTRRTHYQWCPACRWYGVVPC